MVSFGRYTGFDPKHFDHSEKKTYIYNVVVVVFKYCNGRMKLNSNFFENLFLKIDH